VNGDKQRQKLLLVILGVLLLAVLWLYWPDSGDDTAPAGLESSASLDPESAEDAGTVLPGGNRPAPSNSPRQIPTDRVLPLRLADLNRVASTYEPGRDPWRFVDPPPPPPPPPPAGPSPEELARIRAEQERLARLQAEEQARQRAEALIPKPPPFTLKYMGNFGPERLKIAVFTDGTTTTRVREGEVFAGEFILAKIGYESVDIKYVNFPDQPPLRVAVAAGR
jgi:hypothetical protein